MQIMQEHLSVTPTGPACGCSESFGNCSSITAPALFYLQAPALMHCSTTIHPCIYPDDSAERPSVVLIATSDKNKKPT